MTLNSLAAVSFAMKCLHCPLHRKGRFRNGDPNSESGPNLLLTILAMADRRERRFHLSAIAYLPTKAAANHLSHSHLPTGSKLQNGFYN
jgi:hypothetical protein